MEEKRIRALIVAPSGNVYKEYFNGDQNNHGSALAKLMIRIYGDDEKINNFIRGHINFHNDMANFFTLNHSLVFLDTTKGKLSTGILYSPLNLSEKQVDFLEKKRDFLNSYHFVEYDYDICVRDNALHYEATTDINDYFTSIKTTGRKK